METNYDAIVIGGGPGGYLAAERLSRKGKKALLIEADTMGGTCLNVGCIPTKTLINSAKHYLHSLESLKFGVKNEGTSYDWQLMQDWKTEVITKLVAGLTLSVEKSGVTILTGKAIFEGPGRVRVDEVTYTCEHVILATGSVPVIPRIPGIESNDAVIDSTGILSLKEVPNRLAIIGGGVIGVEFASLFAALGSEVIVIEMLDEVIPFADADLARQLRQAMKSVTFKLGNQVESIAGNTVTYSKNGERHTLEVDKILVAIGRKPAVTGWGAENTTLDFSAKGITVDDRMRTNLPNVWAVGDVTGRSLLAHAAYRMGEIAAANILDPYAWRNGETMRWHTMPWCLYSFPELAGVGLSESEAKRTGRKVLVGKVPGQKSGRFIAENGFDAPGTAKVIVDAETKKVLGVHVLGAYASEMIWGAQVALETELTIHEFRQLVFPHPTVSEVIREAAWAVKA